MIKTRILCFAFAFSVPFALATSPASSGDAISLKKLARIWQTAPGQFPPGKIEFTKNYRITSTPSFSDISAQHGYFNFLTENTITVTPDDKQQPASRLAFKFDKKELKLTYATGETQVFVPAKAEPKPAKTKKIEPKKVIE